MSLTLYYDMTSDKRYSPDPEGNLCWVCDDCAQEHDGVDITLAANQTKDCVDCDICGNDPCDVDDPDEDDLSAYLEGEL